jgi:hypothetical protein
MARIYKELWINYDDLKLWLLQNLFELFQEWPKYTLDCLHIKKGLLSNQKKIENI